MGLDTTHDCYQGTYGMFFDWREALHALIMGADYSNLADESWERYTDWSSPLNCLMSHSDCDGNIPAWVCNPLADELEALLSKIPREDEDSWYPDGNDEMRTVTERFIAGLRLAARLNEPVEFF